MHKLIQLTPISRCWKGGSLLPSIACAILFSATCSAGEAVAKFAAGEGLSSADQFPGCSGGGWADRWKISPESSVDISASVLANPAFPNSAKVLEIRRTQGKNVLTLSRTLERNSVDTTQAHTISFDIQAGEYSGENDGALRLTISGSAASESQGSRSAPAVWSVLATQNGWTAYGRGSDGGIMIASIGMKFSMQVVYSLEIAVNPANHSYRVSISNGAMKSQSPEMLFLPGDASPAPEQLSFCGWVQQKADGPFAWSLANIVVKQAP